MRIIFIRHGEPDYEHDSLTEKGWREAEFLAKRVAKWDVKQFYCSPLGRAQATASCSLEAVSRSAITLPWIKEFSYRVTNPSNGHYGNPWDFMPEYWTKVPEYYDKDRWADAPLLTENKDLKAGAAEVCRELDNLLASYGYERDGACYHVAEHNDDTIVIFCHLGAALLAIGHLCGISPSVLWHSVFLPTTSVTVLNCEERQNDTGYFRIQVMGDTRHLYENGEPVSIAGSYAEPFQE